MSNILSKVIIFATGAAIGSFVTWKLVKDKYERQAQEDIGAMEDYYTKREKRLMSESKEKPVELSDFTEEELNERYQRVLGETGYSKQSDKVVDDGLPMPIAPYVIPPEEVGETGYEIESLTYYADGTLTNEFDEPIIDIDGTVGEDFHTHFGEYEDDSVFIRNEQLEIDFEILADTRNFDEINKRVVTNEQ